MVCVTRTDSGPSFWILSWNVAVAVSTWTFSSRILGGGRRQRKEALPLTAQFLRLKKFDTLTGLLLLC